MDTGMLLKTQKLETHSKVKHSVPTQKTDILPYSAIPLPHCFWFQMDPEGTNSILT